MAGLACILFDMARRRLASPGVQPQTGAISSKVWPHVGPYSRKLDRGALGVSIDGRSPLGKFVRSLEFELYQYVGGQPDVRERLMIDRVIKTRVQLDLFEEKLETGRWTDTDRRTYGALHNAFRLALRELKPATSKNQPADLESYIASLRTVDSAAVEPSAEAPAVTQKPLRRPTG